MRGIHPNFNLSEPTRGLSTRILILGVLVIAFKAYAIPLSKLTFIDIPTEVAAKQEGVPVLGISTVLAIVAIFLFISLVGRYLGELAHFNTSSLNETEKSFLGEKSEKAQTDDAVVTASHLALTNIGLEREKYDRMAERAAMIRCFTELILPSIVVVVAFCVEIGNIVGIVRVLF